MTTTAETFFQSFRPALVALGRTVPDIELDGESMLASDWSGLSAGSSLVQYRCWTERYIGPVEFTNALLTRTRVIRLKMDFWYRLLDTESEYDVLGRLGAAGQMNTDNELFGSPEYWRDVYPSAATDDSSISSVAEGGEPQFTVENIGGVLMHYTISIGLLAVP